MKYKRKLTKNQLWGFATLSLSVLIIVIAIAIDYINKVEIQNQYKVIQEEKTDVGILFFLVPFGTMAVLGKFDKTSDGHEV